MLFLAKKNEKNKKIELIDTNNNMLRLNPIEFLHFKIYQKLHRNLNFKFIIIN